jgi:hypothetical protein
MYAVIKATVAIESFKIYFLLKAFKNKSILRFNLNHYFYYNIQLRFKFNLLVQILNILNSICLYIDTIDHIISFMNGTLKIYILIYRSSYSFSVQANLHNYVQYLV